MSKQAVNEYLAAKMRHGEAQRRLSALQKEMDEAREEESAAYTAMANARGAAWEAFIGEVKEAEDG